MVKFSIDLYSVFQSRLALSGWVLDVMPIKAVDLVSKGLPNGRQSLLTYGVIDSPDVAQRHGDIAARVRFSETFEFNATTETLNNAFLQLTYIDGRIATVENLVGRQPNPAGAVLERFSRLLLDIPHGHLLEVGSRARSGVVRRNMAPKTWSYTGVDVMAGPNVDTVGDVHEVDTFLPLGAFQAVMAFSVLEHLLMPWKAVIALNRVMSVGAIGLFTTHQCWPLHDEPWDFWRFSDRAWDGLLNKATGFEIIEAAMGEPAFIVAQRCHPVTNFGVQTGFLASNVLFRKVGPTRLKWQVSVNDVTSTNYPIGNIP